MRVLGLCTGSDSGAAVVEDGRILAAVNEERLSRLKLVTGFPRGSIARVLEMTGTRPADLDAVLVGTRHSTFRDELEPFEGWFQEAYSGEGAMLKRLAGRLARYRNRVPGLEAGYYALQLPRSLHRQWATRRVLGGELGIDAPVTFVDHHLAHVASAYFTSGFGDALVVSMDGGGDGRSSLVHAVRSGSFERLDETSAYDSLGNWYAYVTHLCGFKANRHEGKITGLAARGEPRYEDLLARFVDLEDGSIVNKGEVAFLEAVEELDRRLPDGWKREDLAASVQRHFERVVPAYVEHWRARAGLGDVAVAGGVFANVRVNQEVHELPGVDRFSVHPHMGDGGLAVGAALAASIPGVLDETMPWTPRALEHAYLGPSLAESEIDAALSGSGLACEDVDGPVERRIAELLAEGHVVARAAGAMEYGPRALGNRSILYHPTDPSVDDWLNERLQRTDFMPFAPAVLAERASELFEGLSGAERPAEFMTITFACTPWTRRHMPGVVHVDGTARPQLVRRRVNPGFHAVLAAFEQLTGLSGVLNTSFNLHEEPIVCTAADCVRAFVQADLDYLALGRRLIRNPDGVRRELAPARPARALEA